MMSKDRVSKIANKRNLCQTKLNSIASFFYNITNLFDLNMIISFLFFQV